MKLTYKPQTMLLDLMLKCFVCDIFYKSFKPFLFGVMIVYSHITYY